MAQAAKKDDGGDEALRERIRAELRAENMPEDEKRVRAIVREESEGVFKRILGEFFGEEGDAGKGDEGDPAVKENAPKGSKKGGLFSIFTGEVD